MTHDDVVYWERFWADVDRLAVERGMEEPSRRKVLVERVAWGIHASRGLGSPRQAWAEMPRPEKVELCVQAAGAMAAYERYR